MRKALFAGGILVALVAVVLVHATRVDAQNRNRSTVQAPFLPLLGPGSSIGITVRDSDSGVVVQRVQADSPASRAGVKEGDILTDFDGERTRSALQFTRLVRETAPGKTVKMTVLRGGTPTMLDIAPELPDSDDIRFPNLPRDLDGRLQVLPRGFDFGDGFFISSPRRLGATITPLSDQLAAYFGVKQGVLITEVTAGSPAETAGLKAGDVITAIKGQTVSSAEEVVRELRDVASGTSVEIRVVRDRKELTLTATMPERARTVAPRGGRAI